MTVIFFICTIKKGQSQMNIVFQQSLRPELPTVYGPIEYHHFRSQLEEIDRLLVESQSKS